ncbi:MAG: T9SS type A sorting domain-containing protein, partial [Bacteroidales bacterium]|nr:T9SS type A sorting domain-containing protein [Bacteroidales bacterium]
LTPDMPVGADTVDLAYTTSSTYTVTPSNFATDYLWALYPSEAGNISSEMNNATIEWSLDYLGEAYIKVKAINDCGESDFSDSLKIYVENTVGINRLSQSENINLYPNPNTGTFKLVINDATSVKNIKIYNSIGSIVFEDNKITSKYSKNINLNNFPNGVYYLSVNKNNNNAVFKKIIIQK